MFIEFICIIRKLQIPSIKFHVTDFLKDHLLDLVAVLLVHVIAGLLRLVGTDQPLLGVAQRLNGFLLALVTDLPGLLLAVLGVAVLLGLLRASLHLKLADLLGLEMAVLLLNWEGEDVGELLAVPVHVSLANLDLDLSGDVVTILSWLSVANNSLRTIAIILGALVPLAVELDRVGAGNVVDYLFLHVAVRGLHVGTLIVVLRSHVDLVGGVAHPVLAREAPLHLISLLQGLVVDRLHQVAYQLVDIEAYSLDIGFNNSSAVIERLEDTRFLILSVACSLYIRLALVLEHHLLDHVTVGVLVDTIAAHVCLPYIRVIMLGRSRCWVFWWRKSQHQ